jgi:AmmeMemoRadiSam system protein B
MSQPSSPQPQTSQAKFDPNAAHQLRPRLRPVRGFQAQAKDSEGKEFPMLGLADARQLSDRIVMTTPAAVHILPLMDGSRDLDAIITQVGRGLNRTILEQLVAQLDDAALIEGPTFVALRDRVRGEFDSLPILPPGSTAAFTDMLVANVGASEKPRAEQDEIAKAELRKALDAWIGEALKDAPDPAFNTLPKAVVAPHLDYPRGWMNYAHVYGRLRVTDRPDRVVVLGTNHFGEGTGVIACDKGFSTALGACELDAELLGALKSALGPENAGRLLADRFDHEREHSVELQIPWIQHAFGVDAQGKFPRVLGVLVHDPSAKAGESYDGKGLALQPFVDALKKAIASMPGRTLVVASADLSHCGPAFGDAEPLIGDDEASQERREKILTRDRDMVTMLIERRPDDLVSAMAWEQNPTRWCSIGNLVATLLAVEPSSVRLLNYVGTMDEQGLGLVSSVAMVME